MADQLTDSETRMCCPRCFSAIKGVYWYASDASKRCTKADHHSWHGVLPVEPQPLTELQSNHAARTKLNMKFWTAMHKAGIKSEWDAQEKIKIDDLAKLMAVETVPVVPPDAALRAAHAIQSEIAPVDLMWGSDEVAAKIAGIIQRELVPLDTEESECPRCIKGIYNGKPCAICNGSGKISEASLLGVVPQGAEHRGDIFKCAACKCLRGGSLSGLCSCGGVLYNVSPECYWSCEFPACACECGHVEGCEYCHILCERSEDGRQTVPSSKAD